MAQPWRLLDLPDRAESASEGLPPLLISHTFTTGSYTIRLTDLTRLWTETLARRAIIARSCEEDTSIDPSEDAQQLQILLDKFEHALQRGENTTLALQVNSKRRKDNLQVRDIADLEGANREPHLTLHLSVDLPGGLAPLKWPVYLSLAPQGMLTSFLTMPLLRAQYEKVEQTRSLVRCLKEKDVVIQKLMDKLEAQGMELAQIFPYAVGKLGRKFNRVTAEEKVKGLGRFEVDKWSKDMEGAHPEMDAGDILGNVFSDENPLSIPVDVPDHVPNWWGGMDGKTFGLSSSSGSANKHVSRKASTRERAPEPENGEKDDFQVQGTPPSAHSERVGPSSSLQESAEDEHSGNVAPTQGSNIPDSFPHVSPPAEDEVSPKKHRELGLRTTTRKPASNPVHDDGSTTEDDAEDSPRTIAKQHSPSPSPPAKRKGKLGQLRTRQASLPPKSPSPPAHAEERTSESEAEPAEPPPRRKLGAIGSRNAARQTGKRDPHVADDESTTSGAKKRKLGAIGKNKHVHASEKRIDDEGDADMEGNDTSKVDNAEVAIRGREQTQKEKTTEPAITETAEELADRKRHLLKSELEAKSKAPVKKKKRF